MADLSGIVKQLVAERDRINAPIEALEGVSNTSSRRGRARGKRTLSASARARIAAAQRKRWAKVRAKKNK